MALSPALTDDWRSGLPARLGAAAVIGAMTGGAGLLTGHLMPMSPLAVECHPAGGLGCAIAAPVTGVLLGALLWLLVVVAVTMVVGAVLTGLTARLAGVRLGVGTPAAWPVLLWVVGVLLRPAGVTLRLTGAAVPGYVALAFVLTAVLTAPRFRPTVRLGAATVLAAAVIAILAIT